MDDEVPVDLQSNCPYAFPHRYCMKCPVSPCPAGVPQRPQDGGFSHGQTITVVEEEEKRSE